MGFVLFYFFLQKRGWSQHIYAKICVPKCPKNLFFQHTISDGMTHKGPVLVILQEPFLCFIFLCAFLTGSLVWTGLELFGKRWCHILPCTNHDLGVSQSECSAIELFGHCQLNLIKLKFLMFKLLDLKIMFVFTVTLLILSCSAISKSWSFQGLLVIIKYRYTVSDYGKSKIAYKMGKLMIAIIVYSTTCEKHPQQL